MVYEHFMIQTCIVTLCRVSFAVHAPILVELTIQVAMFRPFLLSRPGGVLLPDGEHANYSLKAG